MAGTPWTSIEWTALGVVLSGAGAVIGAVAVISAAFLVFAVRQKVPASQVDRTLFGLNWHEKFRLFSGNFATDSEH
jgi:hypothetical protein